ncbi:reverse transcriptase [Phytophthora cinnamomi]|uniref:reverse transcriptase n=1 Tax=Phytophthora cinnamomi TaxID=4785 RepID=UPI003559BBF6|nr:reverse transcriptase [Phytophthora cinnamomi]
MILQLFLNNKLAESPYVRKKPHYSDISSLWSDIQEHVHTYALSFETAPETTTVAVTSGPQTVPQGPLHLRVPHFKDWLGRKTVLRHLKLHLKLKHRDHWKAMKKQGCTVPVHGGRGSTFITNPSRLWDIDYTFVMKARLDVVDTSAVLKRRTLRNHGTCRYPSCNQVETLNHVLEHCPGTRDIIRNRHDDALKIIAKELEAG